MIVLINRTKTKIQSFHRREVLLQPGRNEIDESTLTSSERAMIDGLLQAGVVERGAASAPASIAVKDDDVKVIIGPTPGVETLTADEARERGYPNFGSPPVMLIAGTSADAPATTTEESQPSKRKRARP